MRRREFITLLGGAVASWPLRARAQQSERKRRIGVLMGWNEKDREAQSNLAAFVQELGQLGWTDGRNMRIDYRWSNGDVNRMQTFATELVGSAPDAILAHTTPVTAALQRETRTVPIVFVVVSDPVGEGFVASLPRPGGNITGFIHTEGEFAGKLLELLTEIAPTVKRAAIVFNPDTAPGHGSYYLPSFEMASRSFRLEATSAPVHNDAEIETTVAALGRAEGGGLVAMPDGFTLVHRTPIILQAARNKVRRSIGTQSLLEMAACSLTDLTPATYFDAPPPISIAFSMGQSRPSCRFSCRPNFKWLSTLRPPRRLASRSRRRSFCAPTR